MQKAFSNVKIGNESDESGSDVNSGVNSNHSSEESGHTTNSSGLGSSIVDSSDGRRKFDPGEKVRSYSCRVDYVQDSNYCKNNSSWAKFDKQSLNHSKSMKIHVKPAIVTPQIKQVKLQRHKSTIGGYSSRPRNLKKSNSISYTSKLTSENPNVSPDKTDVSKLYEQRLKQFQQQYPSIDPSRQHLGRQIVGLNRINSNPTQHHINLVRTMSVNARSMSVNSRTMVSNGVKKSFRDMDGCSSVLYA